MSDKFPQTHKCEMIGEIKTMLAQLDAHVRHSAEEARLFREALQQHHEALYGNGDEGLKTRVALLEATDKSRTNYIKLVWGSLSAALVSLLVQAYQHFLKHQ